MAVIEFNTTTITWGSVIVDAPVSSMSFMGGTRSEVPIVTSGGKYSYAGLRTPRKAQFTLVLDDPTLAELQTAVETCAPASLVINYTPCGGSETAFFTKNAWITDYSTTASVDGVFEADITFLYDETPT